MKKITLLLIALLISTVGFSQTVLTAGDIAFVGSNSDGATNADDTVAFVLLKDIDAATTIIFTDMGWNDGTGFFAVNGDGEFTWTSGIARTAGEVVTIDMSPLFPAAYSAIGDQLFAIQGSTAAPIFIAGLQYNDSSGDDANWDGAAISNSTSALPNALVTGVTAVRLVPEQDNWQFSCVAAGGPVAGTPAQIRAIVNNRANWGSNNDTPYNPALESGCTFTVSGGGDTTPPEIFCAPTPPPITAGVDGMAAIPDLVSGTSATDNVSIPANITITQSPTAGTMVGVGVFSVVLTATDEAGNSASCTISVTVNEPPSTTLNPGDIAFVGFNLDGNDSFAFIILKDIIAGTNIKFTDCGVSNPNTITCVGGGDGSATWYASSAMSAGDIVTLPGSFMTGSILSSIGDQLFAYQGTAASPTFITGIHSNVDPGGTTDADWDGDNTSSTTSALPDQLTNGVNAIRLYVAGTPDTEVDNWQFDCTSVPGGLPLTGTAAELSAIINDIQYWTSNDINEFVPTAKSGCSYNVLPPDTTPPVAVCTDVTIQLDGTGNVTLAASDVDGGSSDDSGSFTLSVSPNTFTCANVGANTVTLTVTDAAGNSSTCTATVTVEDIVAPVATCQAFTAQLDATGNVTIAASDIDNGSTDNCGIASLSVSPAAFTCANIGANTVTLTVTDVNGNSSTCTSTVTVEDNIAPTASCQDITILLDAAGNASITAADVDNGSTDNCAVASLSVSPSSFTCADVGPNTVTLTVTDTNGNSSTCTSTVTVQDSTAPTAVCQDTTIALDASGNATITAVDIDNGSMDVCGIASLSVSPTAFTCSDIGPNTVTLTVTDVNGNSSTCTSIVTITDPLSACNQPPVAVCQPVTVNADGSCQGNAVASDFDGGSSDPDGDPLTFTVSPVGPYPLGITNVTLTVSDGMLTDTCTTTITVVDTTPPVISCPANITQDNDLGICGAVVTYTAPVGTDNCSGATTVQTAGLPSGATFPVGTTTNTFVVTDGAGTTTTCSFDVIINDIEAPIANCAAPFSIQLDTNGEATIAVADIENGSTDNCGIATTMIDVTNFDCTDVGPNTVTLTVTDVNGNTSTCSTVVTVEDSIAPIIVCPADLTANTEAGNCFATVSYPMPIALDNCGVDTVVQTAGLPSGSQFPVGISTVEFTATDVNGNLSTCSFNITVIDNEAPVAVCQNITIQLDASGNASIVAADVDGGSTDQCGIASTTININSFDCSNVGNNDVILTVTDVNGNVSTCTAIVTVEDVSAPIVACQDITVELDPVTGTVTIAGTDIDNGSSDACGIVSYDLDIDTFNCSNIGANQVILTVTDVNGNTATCSATVTVEDNTSPILVCQDFTIEIGANGTAILDPSDVIASNDDACGIFTVAVDITEFSCADIGNPITVQVFSQDNNGNLSTCTATVTAVDVMAPIVTCPADQTVDPGAGNLFYSVPDYFATGEATAMDNCTDPVTITGQDPAAGSLLPDGVYTITLTATDEYGNIGTCEFELTVESVLGNPNNNPELGSVTLYPIPAKNVLNLSNPQSKELERLEIYDLRGRLVLAEDLRGMGASKTIDVHLLAPASYYVKIKGKDGNIVRRLLKE
ncbi:MAG: hypothetical protein CL527_05990 [Aequorivita sp.]|nr:hypothetical protein [Aequorivita sp.]